MPKVEAGVEVHWTSIHKEVKCNKKCTNLEVKIKLICINAELPNHAEIHMNQKPKLWMSSIFRHQVKECIGHHILIIEAGLEMTHVMIEVDLAMPMK